MKSQVFHKQRIYTKSGDAGQTSLIGGQRIGKNDIQLEAYGCLDELNSFVGLLCDYVKSHHDRDFLTLIQGKLFSLGSLLASDFSKKKTLFLNIDKSDIELLESQIDKMTEDLPKLTSFLLPGGHKAVSYSHLARSVCRRCERRIYEFSLQKDISQVILPYINRLSDYFFILSRKISRDFNITEKVWDGQ